MYLVYIRVVILGVLSRSASQYHIIYNYDLCTLGLPLAWLFLVLHLNIALFAVH